MSPRVTSHRDGSKKKINVSPRTPASARSVAAKLAGTHNQMKKQQLSSHEKTSILVALDVGRGVKGVDASGPARCGSSNRG